MSSEEKGSEEYKKGKGYHGKSMSNNAIEAYDRGDKPFSKWRKKDILSRLREYGADDDFINAVSKFSLDIIKKYILVESPFHHTGWYANRTPFYHVKDIGSSENATQLLQQMADEKELKKHTVMEITSKRIVSKKYYRVMMRYFEKTVDGRHKWYISGEGVVCDNWCYLKNKTKKNVNGKHFTIIEHLEELPDGFSLDDYYDEKYEYKKEYC